MVHQQRYGPPNARQAAEKTYSAAGSAPSLSLSNGDGAVRGMGQKVAADGYLKRIRYGNQPPRLIQRDLTELTWLAETDLGLGGTERW